MTNEEFNTGGYEFGDLLLSVTAMLVTFFLLPTAYAVVERRKDRRAGIAT